MFGTKVKLNWLLYGLVFAWYGHSCQTSPSSPSQDAFQLEGETVGLSQAQSGQKNKGKDKIAPKLKSIHPEKPDAWHTRKLIMTHQQPDPDQILQCKSVAESTTLNASNLRSLDDATTALSSKVSSNQDVYHWCFYQLMVDLDLRLERESPLLTEKSEAFLTRMKVLWVIARSLDKAKNLKKSIYTNYVKTRYIELSESQFGRHIEELDSESLLVTAGKSGKSAAEYSGP